MQQLAVWNIIPVASLHIRLKKSLGAYNAVLLLHCVIAGQFYDAVNRVSASNRLQKLNISPSDTILHNLIRDRFQERA
jgi:hypothetical protein